MSFRDLLNPSPPPNCFRDTGVADVKKEKENIGPNSDIKCEEYDYYDEDDEECTPLSRFMDAQAVASKESSFYCDVCKSSMNSELIFMNHLQGKRHKKRLTSLNYTAPSTRDKKVLSNASFQQIKTTGEPILVPTRHIGGEPLIQGAIDAHKGPIIGLNFITEIRMCDDKDPVYFCHLCPAECQQTTLINHVIGYKHRMAYMKLADPVFHEKLAYSSEKRSTLSRRIEKFAKEMEESDGRGQMIVEEQIDSDHCFVVQTKRVVPELPPSLCPDLIAQVKKLSNEESLALLLNVTRDMEDCDMRPHKKELINSINVAEDQHLDAALKYLTPDVIVKHIPLIKQMEIIEFMEKCLYIEAEGEGSFVKSAILSLYKEGKLSQSDLMNKLLDQN